MDANGASVWTAGERAFPCKIHTVHNTYGVSHRDTLVVAAQLVVTDHDVRTSSAVVVSERFPVRYTLYINMK